MIVALGFFFIVALIGLVTDEPLITITGVLSFAVILP